jgi:hypothetical protein
MKETPFKVKIENLLKDNGAWYIKYWAGAKFTKEGIPDILACIEGLFFGMELKGDGGQPTLLQIVNLRKIRAANGMGVLLYPKDFEKFKSILTSGHMDWRWYEKNIEEQDKWFKKLNS